MGKQYYYHLTTSDCVDTIKHEGLKPMLGENALLIKETKPKLCLCSDKSIDAWAIMLSADTVIKVSVPDKNKLHLITNDGTVDEFNYDGEIPAKYIEGAYKVNPSDDVWYKLRENYIGALSEFCVLCARYYTDGTGWRDDDELQAEIEESIQITGELIIPVIPRLHYENMSREEKREILHMYGESGAYTFCDDYGIDYGIKPIKRLYQMLIQYPDDQFTELRRSIYKLIKQNFKYCLRTNTGGWTG